MGMGSKQAGSLKERLHLGEMKYFHTLYFLDLYSSLKSQTLPQRWICKSTFYTEKLVGSRGRERTNQPRELLRQLDICKMHGKDYQVTRARKLPAALATSIVLIIVASQC